MREQYRDDLLLLALSQITQHSVTTTEPDAVMQCLRGSVTKSNDLTRLVAAPVKS